MDDLLEEIAAGGKTAYRMDEVTKVQAERYL